MILRAGWRDPLAVLSARADEPWALALLSGGGERRGRWSYLAFDPEAVLLAEACDPADPFDRLADFIGPFRAGDPDGPPFQGGVAGLASYELAARVEAVPMPRKPGWPDLACARYPAVLAFDHARSEVLAVGRGRDAERRADQALSWLEGAQQTAFAGPLAADFTAPPDGPYEAAVADVVARIEAGEIFQANIARPWAGRLAASARPFDLFARLATESPAPFAAYLRLPDRAVVSNSPERFLEVRPRDGAFRVETRPIKGTRPRGRDPLEDSRQIAALAASEKDRAENLMIVDLMRNDLARVCTPGAVRAPELFQVESFANVHHLVSTVTGELAPGMTAVDLFRAAFPPGSITGAPKVQALKVIAGHEDARGPYCGSMFWAGFDGGFDSSVLIRTAVLEADADGWSIEARAGAGIVADSNPFEERRETEAKISAIRQALLGEGS